MKTNNIIASVETEHQEESKTLQELPKSKQKNGILKTTAKWLTAFSLATAVILTPQKSAKSETAKDNLKLKPLKGSSLQVPQDTYAEEIDKIIGLKPTEEETTPPLLLASADQSVMTDIWTAPQVETVEAEEKDQVHKSNLKILSEIDLPDDLKKSLIEISEENKKRRETWNSFLDIPVRIQYLQGWLKTKDDLNFLARNVAEEKPRTFKEITWFDGMAKKDTNGDYIIDDEFYKNYKEIVKKLCDTSHLEEWLKNWKWDPASKEEVNKLKASIKGSEERYLTFIERAYIETNQDDKENGRPENTTFSIFLENYLKLTDDFIKKAKYSSLEVLREGILIDSWSIAYHISANETHRRNPADQIVKFCLLTWKPIDVAKLQIWDSKHLTMHKKHLQDIFWPILVNKEWVWELEKVFNDLPRSYKVDYTQSEDLAKSTKDLNKTIAINAQLDEDRVQINRYWDLGDKMWILIDKFLDTWDAKYIKEAQGVIVELKEVREYFIEMKKRETAEEQKETTKAIQLIDRSISDFEKNYLSLIAKV